MSTANQIYLHIQSNLNLNLKELHLKVSEVNRLGCISGDVMSSQGQWTFAFIQTYMAQIKAISIA